MIIFDFNAVVSNFYVKVAHCLIGFFFRCFFFLLRLRLYLSSEESKSSLGDGSDKSSFRFLQRFFFFLIFFFFALESNEDVSNESDDEGSGSGFTSGSCSFLFFSENYVGHVSSSKYIVSVSSSESVGRVSI